MAQGMTPRRLAASDRKMKQALKVFEGTLINVLMYGSAHKPKKNSVEIQVVFDYLGSEYRFDYEIDLDKRLPKVETIRQLMWGSLIDYRASV